MHHTEVVVVIDNDESIRKRLVRVLATAGLKTVVFFICHSAAFVRIAHAFALRAVHRRFHRRA